MTPLERLIDDHTLAFQLNHWYALEAYERKAKAEIKAMVECANRSIGQKFRYAKARLKRDFEARERAARLPRLGSPHAVRQYTAALVNAHYSRALHALTNKGDSQ